MTNNKQTFYQLNPKFFKDQNGDGIGDLEGLANKFDYFEFLGVDAIILEEIISTDTLNNKQSFTMLDPQIGDINDLKKVIALAKKFGKKLLIELNIGTIKEENDWFASAKTQEVSQHKNLVEFVEDKPEDSENYKYSQDMKKYYFADHKTKEIPLNWNSSNTLNEFVEVIKFWINVGIDGFVFKRFEYLFSKDKQEMMNETTLKELRKIYRAVKEVNKDIMLIGKSDVVPVDDGHLYTSGPTHVFDYFLSTKVSQLDLHERLGIDYPGRFTSRKLVQVIQAYASNPRNILSFGSNLIGRPVSRWVNDTQYWKESAKSLAILLTMNKSSIGIYQGEELGTPNIGLTHLDDFDTHDIEDRKHKMLKNRVSEKEFYQAQTLQNAINARSPMAWNDEVNGGFSNATKIVSPVISRHKEINVSNEFLDENSVLFFYKELISRATKLNIGTILDEGKFKVVSLLSGLIKIHAKADKKEIFVFANLTKKTKHLPRIIVPKGQVVMSSYERKEYEVIPNTLDAYETIVISKDTDEYLKMTRQIMIKSIREKMTKEKEKLVAQQKAEADAQRALKEDEANKLKLQQEQEAADKAQAAERAAKIKAAIKQVQEEERAKLFNSQKKEKPQAPVQDDVSHGQDQTGPTKLDNNTNDQPAGEQKASADIAANTELNTLKEKMQVDRHQERSHLDEATKLREDEVAKTTLINEDADLDDLFEFEDKKK